MLFPDLVLEWSHPYLSFSPVKVWRSRLMPARLDEVDIRPGLRLTLDDRCIISIIHSKPYPHGLDTNLQYSQMHFTPM